MLEKIFKKIAKHLGFTALVNLPASAAKRNDPLWVGHPLLLLQGVFGFVPVPGVLPSPSPTWLNAPVPGFRPGQRLLHPVSSDSRMVLSENQCHRETFWCSEQSDNQMLSLSLSNLYKCNENLKQKNQKMGKLFRFPSALR